MSAAEEAFELALASQERFEAAGGTGPAGPLFQWSAQLEIENLRGQFEAGDRMALLAAIRKCFNHDLVAPEWVKHGYIRGYDQVLNCRVGSWDEAFGLPYRRRKKAQLSGMSRRRRLRFVAYRAVRKMSEQGLPIDKLTFAVIADRIGSNATEVGQLYYDVVAMHKKKRAPKGT